MRKQNAPTAQSGKTKTSKTSSVKEVKKMDTTEKDLSSKTAVEPNPADIARIRVLNMDPSPDKHEPIILSDTWYEFSVFSRKLGVSPNTANMWLKNGWLPFTQIKRIRYINKADFESFMLKFRKSGPGNVS